MARTRGAVAGLAVILALGCGGWPGGVLSSGTVTSDEGTMTFGEATSLPDDLPFTLPGEGWTPELVLTSPSASVVTVVCPLSREEAERHFRAELARLGCASPSVGGLPGMVAWECAPSDAWSVLGVSFTTGEPFYVNLQYGRRPVGAE